ncbi:MAG: T9SS type A sorting domain-containing protein [Bacteroidales bacterium]|jgi:hypothetical protein|nr:T9SS type A sorting domain-containing protein [Bacteroidales bacterium]
MKKKSLFLIILLFLSISSFPQNTFFRIYPSPEYNSAFSVSETLNHDFILCGNKETTPGSAFMNAQLWKIDTDGNIIQDTNFYSNQIQTLFSTIRKSVLNDNVFFIVGNKDSISNDASFNSINLWKLDDNLNFLQEYEENFGNSLLNTPQGFVNINDSVVFVVSIAHIMESPSPDLSLLKFNLSTDSTSLFIPEQHFFRLPTGIIMDQLNNLIRIPYYGPTEKGSVKIISFDTDLNIVSVFEPEITFRSAVGITNSNDTSYIINGNARNSQETYSLFISNFTFGNELINQTEIESDQDTLIYPGSGVNTLVLDSCLWAVGIYNMHPEQGGWPYDPSWVQLNRINNAFELTEQRFFGGDAHYIPYDIIKTSDGGIMVVGNRYDRFASPVPFQKDPFVLKLNSEGLIVNVDNPEQPIAQEALVFPNPGKEFLQVKLAVQHKSAQFQLFDMGGRLVLETDLSGDMQRVETAQLGSRAYIYRITASNRVIGSGKWVKE